MPYGLRVKKSGGKVRLTTVDLISRFRYSNIVVADADGNSGSLSDIAGKKTVEFAYAINVTTADKAPHGVSRSGTTISWTATSVGIVVDSIDSAVFSFLYT